MYYEQNYQGNYGSMKYNVDLVFCIDATGSMEDASGKQAKIINMVKQNALNFYNDFSRVMMTKGKQADQLRVRLVVFRDYLADGEHAMQVTDFFDLPRESDVFKECVNSIHAEGGGDIPEDGLEALSYAIRSNWSKEPGKKRQVIVIWTDAGTHPLGYGKASPLYPRGLPQNLGELSDWWEDPELIDQQAKRLLLYAPDVDNWKYISDNWDLVWHIPSEAGNGLAEQDYQAIMDLITNSV